MLRTTHLLGISLKWTQIYAHILLFLIAKLSGYYPMTVKRWMDKQIIVYEHNEDPTQKESGFLIFYYYYYYYFYFTILYWFCHTSMGICHRCTCVPHPETPSHLPPHTISLGHPSVPTPSFLYPATNLDLIVMPKICKNRSIKHNSILPGFSLGYPTLLVCLL